MSQGVTDQIIDRRAPLTGAAASAAAPGKAVGVSVVPHPIVLYCDLKVDPAREQEMLDHFDNRFRPAAAGFAGFIDLKMLRLRAVMQGPALQDGVAYRFQLTYESDALRQIWVSSPEHAELWPGIETCLADKSFHVSLWDDV
jgi:hypothetical protein